MMDWLQESDAPTANNLPVWKIVIVDDDDEIQKITRLTLNNFEFEGRPLELVSLYSEQEAKKYFKHNHDVALLLLDVVMESETSGFEVVNFIRHELNNTYTRIVLRTGQPGSEPVHSIIENYDIDGYRSKTDITVQVLNQILYIALRSYRDLVRIQNYQKGLELIISSISNLNQFDEILELSKGILTQLSGIFNTGEVHFLVSNMSAITLGYSEKNKWEVVIEPDNVQSGLDNIIGSELKTHAKKVLTEKQNSISQNMYGFYFCSKRKTESVFVLKNVYELTPMAEKLLWLFVNNVVISMENIVLAKQL